MSARASKQGPKGWTDGGAEDNSCGRKMRSGSRCFDRPGFCCCGVLCSFVLDRFSKTLCGFFTHATCECDLTRSTCVPSCTTQRSCAPAAAARARLGHQSRAVYSSRRRLAIRCVARGVLQQLSSLRSWTRTQKRFTFHTMTCKKLAMSQETLPSWFTRLVLARCAGVPAWDSCSPTLCWHPKSGAPRTLRGLEASGASSWWLLEPLAATASCSLPPLLSSTMRLHRQSSHWQISRARKLGEDRLAPRAKLPSG